MCDFTCIFPVAVYETPLDKGSVSGGSEVMRVTDEGGAWQIRQALLHRKEGIC
jgi:hypothetical protein